MNTKYYCLDCVIKHLADAKVLYGEFLTGYKDHILDVIGNLSQASLESVGVSPEFAEEVRQHRLMLMENYDYQVPYYDLYHKVEQIKNDLGCGNCKKANESFKERLQKKKEN
jgi:hypothetical protein